MMHGNTKVKIGKLMKQRVYKFQNAHQAERAVTWWNPAAQTNPVLDSSSFVAVPTLPRRTCLHSASSVLAVRISFRVFAVFVFGKPLFTVIMAPKRKSSDAGSASKPKRIRDVLSITEKVKNLDMVEIKKIVMRGLTSCMARTKHTTFIAYAALWWKSMIFIVLSSIGTVNDTVQYRYCIFSLLYRLLRIMLNRQNPLLSYVPERKNAHCKRKM